MKNRDNDIIGRQYCAMALGNLAAEPENHMEIVKSEGREKVFVVVVIVVVLLLLCCCCVGRYSLSYGNSF